MGAGSESKNSIEIFNEKKKFHLPRTHDLKIVFFLHPNKKYHLEINREEINYLANSEDEIHLFVKNIFDKDIYF